MSGFCFIDRFIAALVEALYAVRHVARRAAEPSVVTALLLALGHQVTGVAVSEVVIHRLLGFVV